MAFELENTVLDDILCYISTTRNSIISENITLYCVAFYKAEAIKQSKRRLFDICKEKYVQRNACQKHPNPSTADVTDILELLAKTESNKFLIPNFVAGNYASLPPSSGFEALATIMCSLRDEVTALRMEVSDVKNMRQLDSKSMEGVDSVTQDLAEIKTILLSQRNNILPVASVAEIHSENFSTSNTTASQQTMADAVRNGRPPVNQPSQQNRNTIRRESFLNGNSANGQQMRQSSGSTQNALSNHGLASGRNAPNNRVNRRNVVSGSKEGNNNRLNGVQRIIELFVGGCDKTARES